MIASQRSLTIGLLLIVAIHCIAGLARSQPAGEKIAVWVSILPQTFFVERIGGERVTVEVMVGAGESPASYDPTAKQLTRLAGAKLYFAIGVPMEETFLPQARRIFQELDIVDTSLGIKLIRMSEAAAVADGDAEPEHAELEHAEHKHAGHDHHDHEFDPHIWLSPRLARIQAQHICTALERIDPEHTADYRANLALLLADLERIHAEIGEILTEVAGRSLFVFHPAFGYFAAEYGLHQVAIERGGMAPTPKHLAAVLTAARQQGARAIFVQPQVSESAARTAATEVGVAVVALDPLARDYLANLRRMAETIREALTTGE
ncbi:MAG: zinc ABC transporter substrate-binding protein [bacterium]